MLRIVFSFFILFSLLLFASTTPPKQALKTNGLLLYKQQKHVERFSEMFGEGDFFGRIRSNTFHFYYHAPDSSHDTQLVSGLGASLVYRSAIYNGFDTLVGLYGSQAFFDDNKDPLNRLKPGKDVLSRYNYAHTGSKSLAVVGQANIGYRFARSNIRVGRQLVETFYTKSNDTKMIPNTFDGITLQSADIAKTHITLAYLAKQKLRDHEQPHAVLMYDDRNTSDFSQWRGNDDGAMHHGITYKNLKAAGKPTDAPLIVLDGQNNAITNLRINFSGYVVPQLLSQGMLELNYPVRFSSLTINTGVRYIQQFDNGAGKVGGASLLYSYADLSGTTRYYKDLYKNPDSLDAKMIAARVATTIKDYKITLAYTGVLDEADLVAPWRGFPTAGYTRSMGIYNWRANTKSYRLELIKGAKANYIYTSPFIQTSILYVDGDSSKKETQSMFYYFGIAQNLPSLEEFQYKLRLGWRDFIGDSSTLSDYLDARLEFNYLF